MLTTTPTVLFCEHLVSFLGSAPSFATRETCCRALLQKSVTAVLAAAFAAFILLAH
jgi:hypothetical protein